MEFRIYLLKIILFLAIASGFLSIKAFATELNNKIKFEIKASEKLEWYQLENKIVALGNAEVKSNLFKINADEIDGFYNGKIGKGKIKKLIAKKNASFKSSQIFINSNYMEYDLEKEILIVTGNNISMTSNLGSINAQKSLIYEKSKKQIFLEGNVLIELKNPNSKINANRLFISIDEKENITLVKAIDMVNVKLDELQQNIFSDEAEFDNLKRKINFKGNVILNQNDSTLKGNNAIIDFEKGLSSITSTKQSSVTGVFY